MMMFARNLPCFRPLLSGILAAGLYLPAANAASVDELTGRYLTQWSAFYPTRAFAEGSRDAAARFENYSVEHLAQWRELNRGIRDELEALPVPRNADARVDLQVLARQVERELALWRDDRPLQNRPAWYADQVTQALTYLLVSEGLSDAQKREAVLARLDGIRRLCEQGRRELVSGNRLRGESAIRSLDASAVFFREALPALLPPGDDATSRQALSDAARDTAEAVLALRRHIEHKVLPEAVDSPAMGEARYTQLLHRRSDGRLSPRTLADNALAEIELVRGLMVATARDWWRQDRGASAPVPADEALLARALSAMEDDRSDNPDAFLRQFSELTAAAERFVRRRQLATVPEPTTLYIASSPDHFAGAAVGGVYPAGPFAPQSNTLFYLPSIPGDASPGVAEGFYRSFNEHFNTMIISHEMFPGHYMQYKVAVTHAPAIRSIFADGAYVEGWGSFSEELMLEAGWGDNAPLTWLAHYRKRLENATRSYLSVMVHTRGWDAERVSSFAVERGLLAPQFAVNLWQRVVNSPMQLTDYFVGYHQFKQLWREQRALRGEDFDQRRLVDAILRAGPVPVPDLPPLLGANLIDQQ
ncbi:DUF885 family protein [Parahaliea mediterranea]|uniref:DUF885 family protein n=1 Tax=Parahaliea mediterranea TaxID=651086 RepID=A0A939IL41_9GAMM|nr:DUF885 family protein [Parahaliea mediterranea]MBN7795588.1 DUF885 family protein [Parahaliea mediterranea]